MNDPWFDPMRFAWLPGTFLGVAAGVVGTLAGIYAPRGKAKGLVLGSVWALLGISVLLLIAAIVALAAGQPYGVWYGLGLAGLIGTLVLGMNAPMIVRRYRQAEARRIQAHDMR